MSAMSESLDAHPSAQQEKATEDKRATTLVGEPILRGLPICVPKILLPRADIDLTKWACVACDQFTSEPEYWKEMEDFVDDTPSSLRLVFPEVYLSSVSGAPPEEDTARIENICTVMQAYVADGVFAEEPPALVALDRKTPFVPSRKGLVMAVDLEEYNYGSGVATLIRPTEQTIVARLPPRIAIRENAPLELPHIIMIIDDPEKTVIEPLFTDPALTEEKYKIELYKGAGTVRGLRVTEAGTDHVERTMLELHAKEQQAASEAGREPALILIGDGNHSLATAKSCWEKLKSAEGVSMDHPQRYALVELQNLHDEGVVFEPIHRILIGANAEELQAALEVAFGTIAVEVPEPVPLHSVVLVKGSAPADRVMLVPPEERLPVVSMSAAVDAFLAEHPDVKVDYVHGEQSVCSACSDGAAVGLLLPALDKSRFLETLHEIGTLPRKAFSMGEAEEKRFYVEARNILP